MHKLYISEFVHKIPSFDNFYFLYDTRNFNLFKINEDESNLYDKILKDGVIFNEANSFIVDLLENNLLTKKNEDVLLEKNIKINEFKNMNNSEFNINYARIKLTNICNLACKYCFVDKGENYLSKTELNSILDILIDKNKNDTLIIQYFGGEPMLKMELIKYCHNYLLKAYNLNKIKGFREEIVTNGFFLDEENIHYLNDAQIDVTISIDGLKEINDLKRITKDGKGTFDTVKKKINLYKEITGKAPILITLQEHNVYDFANNTKKLIDELGVTSIGINMPQPCKKGWEISGKHMFNSIVSIYDFCLERDIKFTHGGNNIPYAMKFKKRNFGSCSNCIVLDRACKCGVMVDHNLEISTCIIDKNINSTFDLLDFGKNSSSELKKWFINNNYEDKCFKCIAYNICTGMCSMEKEYSNINLDRCYFYKNMVLWTIERLSKT